MAEAAPFLKLVARFCFRASSQLAFSGFFGVLCFRGVAAGGSCSLLSGSQQLCCGSFLRAFPFLVGVCHGCSGGCGGGCGGGRGGAAGVDSTATWLSCNFRYVAQSCERNRLLYSPVRYLFVPDAIQPGKMKRNLFVGRWLPFLCM